MASVTDSNKDNVTFTGVNSPSDGATLSTNSTYVFYTPNGAGDGATFKYTVSDGHGSTGEGTITMNVVTPGGIVKEVTVSGGTASIKLYGIPGIQYDIQRTTDLVHWTTLTPSTGVTPDADGSFSLTDNFSDLLPSPAPSSAFYRSIQH